MTSQEAKSILYDIALKVSLEYSDSDIERKKELNREYQALNIAIDMIRKQIPKKPIHRKFRQNNGRINHKIYCGICYRSQRVALGDKYCRKCGQAIDWSEEECQTYLQTD